MPGINKLCYYDQIKSLMNKIKQSPTSPDDTFSKKKCKKEMRILHNKLFELQNVFYADSRFSLLIIFQGTDTAGKDGTIRHVMSCMNPMGVRVTPFKEPTAEELNHDFLWRIVPHFPAKGMIAVFNRSYYEDILVPFIGKKLSKEELNQRCQLMNVLENHLESNGIHVLKFFLNVSHEEQKKRIKERLTQPHKRWKYSPEDKASADRYDDYMEAYETIIEQCNVCEWHIVPADKRWYRNYAVADFLIKHLESLHLQFPESIKVNK